MNFIGFLLLPCHQPLYAHLTSVFSDMGEQLNFLEMDGGGNRQTHDISNGFMKARVGPTAKTYWLVLILQVVLNVPHFMVYCKELLHSNCCTLLYPAEQGTGKQVFSGDCITIY